MTNGQHVALTALTEEARNLVERPLASNEDGGGWIDEAQHFWGMGAGTSLGPQPWCGAGADRVFQLADVDDHGLCHPATWVIAARADALGGCRPQGLPHPGSLVLRSPVHVEVLIRVRPSGLLECVGCNVNDGMRETVRNPLEYRIVEVPGLREPYPGSVHETVTVYWFEDPRQDPERYGGWRTRAMREAWIEAHVPAAQRELVRRIRVARPAAPYALDLYSGERWKWGPWRSEEARDRVQVQLERELGRQLRARSKDIRADGTGVIEPRRPRKLAGLTTGESTT